VDGTKRWDTCAGEALMRCFGGISTNKDGEEYNYTKGGEVQNLRGVVALLDLEEHKRIISVTKNF
jgi:3'-phosphoadenosine 5'-phosphosulfate (PAPS) 3'-phosphatase